MFKKITYGLLGFALTASLANANEVKTVAITQIVEHPALDACRKGVEDSLKKEGFIEGKNLKILFENAQGQIPNTISIAKKFAGKNPDVIVAIATPSAQAVAKIAQDNGIEMPICQAVYNIISNQVSLDDAITGLLTRPFKDELS